MEKIPERKDYVSDDTPAQSLMSLLQTSENVSEENSLLTVKGASEWILEASVRKDPVPLWLTLWYEGEICCLFADSNLGKSIYAVQIAEEIARKSKRVLYCDFELSDKQFQLRYTNDCGVLHQFSDNLMRAEINTDAICDGVDNLDEELIDEIDRAAKEVDAKIIIIDNLSYICNASDKSDMAGRLMLRLIQLKRSCGYSILVLAHTPKRSLKSPITQNDLAGSKKLFNFFDSVFAIGKSGKDEGLRYVKQLKIRAGSLEYGTENVILTKIEKSNTWLHFEHIGFASELEHLKETDIDNEDFIERVRQYRESGLSMNEIADRLNSTKSRVQRACAKL